MTAPAPLPAQGAGNTVKAALWDPLDGGSVRCRLCAHRCTVRDGKRGLCGMRENRGGTLFTRTYGRLIARHVDPVEKKPLYHFLPGSLSYSISAPGCNFRCPWCQNWEISQPDAGMPPERLPATSPAEVIGAARAAGCLSLSFTYTEPTLLFEFAREAAAEARAKGLASVFVTNGYMTLDMIEALHPLLDAANVDLKAFREDTYRRHCGASLAPVLDSLRALKRLGVWVEVTTLLVPAVNDDPGELREAAAFLASDLGPDTPWHLSRFFPNYRFTESPPTPESLLRQAVEIGREAGLRYVYEGNSAQETPTGCHHCGGLLIRRRGFRVTENRLAHGRCPDCGTPLAGRFQPAPHPPPSAPDRGTEREDPA